MSNITQPIYEVPIWLFHFIPTFGKSAQGVEGSHFLVEGKNKIKARLSLIKEPSFWRNYNKASREEREKMEPFRLRREGKIIQVLECERRHKNSGGGYTCGRPVHSLSSDERRFYSGGNEMSGEFGMCCIEGYNPFDADDCPYND